MVDFASIVDSQKGRGACRNGALVKTCYQPAKEGASLYGAIESYVWRNLERQREGMSP
jgi:hypothetical protein